MLVLLHVFYQVLKIKSHSKNKTAMDMKETKSIQNFKANIFILFKKVQSEGQA